MLNGQHWTPIADEFAGAQLGDLRRTKRLQSAVTALEKNPSASFPTAMASVAGLEGLYRFINNDGFGLKELVRPHAEKSIGRACEVGCVLAIHDTTQLVFSTCREGFGATTHRAVRNGFLAHVTLLAAEKDGTPLGVSHAETWTRTGDKERKKRENRLDPETESEAERWQRGVLATEKCGAGRVDIVHVADAESDIFGFMAAMDSNDIRFVIRSGRKRYVESEETQVTIEEAAATAKARIRRTIELTARRYTKTQARLRSQRHPQRAARRATVAIGAVEITIPSPGKSARPHDDITLNCVRVWETSRDDPDSLVEWVLLTNEPVETDEQLARIVDIYRRRWIIEEFFKALKTGCAIEKRQVESYDALVTVLGMFLPIAYRLLLVRHLDAEQPNAKATTVFSEVELMLMKKAPSNRNMAAPETVHEALLHLARLGGHLRNNGRPGWQTLGRGYEKLLLMLEGWEIANAPN